MEDTWASRDLPVLDATVRVMETNNFPAVRDIAAAAGMDIETTGRALEALDGTYVGLSRSAGGPESWNVRTVSADARRAVGQWPTAESLVTQLAEGPVGGDPPHQRVVAAAGVGMMQGQLGLADPA